MLPDLVSVLAARRNPQPIRPEPFGGGGGVGRNINPTFVDPKIVHQGIQDWHLTKPIHPTPPTLGIDVADYENALNAYRSQVKDWHSLRPTRDTY